MHARTRKQQTLAEEPAGPMEPPDRGAAPTDSVALSPEICGVLVWLDAPLSPGAFFRSYLTFEKCFDFPGSQPEGPTGCPGVPMGCRGDTV